MSKDPNKWKGPSDPLPGMNAPKGPAKQTPKPNGGPAAKPPKREWQPGGLPSSQPSRSAAPQDAGRFSEEQPHQPQAGRDQDSLQSVLPVHADQPQEDESRPTMLEERNRIWWLPLLGFTVVAGIILIVALVVMQQPLSNWSQAQSYAKQQAMIDAQQRAEYQALEADVRGNVRQVQKNLVNLDIQAQDLAADAELRVGQPIQRLQSHPRERSRELDLAILESKDMATNWASLTNAVCRPQEANPVYRDTQDVNNRIQNGKLVPADRALAAGLLTRTKQQEANADKRYGQVRRLTQSLEARRFELLLDSTEGSK